MHEPNDKAVLTLTLRQSGSVDKHIASPKAWAEAPKDHLRQEVATLGLTTVVMNVSPAAHPPNESEQQQDDEALVAAIADIINDTPAPFDDEFRTEAKAILAHLRSQGLMRTMPEARVVEHMKAAERRATDAEEKLAVEEAQVRALTAKAEEAHRHREDTLARLKAANTLAAQEAHKAIAAANREAQANQRWQESEKALAMERESLKAARVRIEALEKLQVEAVKAHEAHRG